MAWLAVAIPLFEAVNRQHPPPIDQQPGVDYVTISAARDQKYNKTPGEGGG